MRFQHVVLGGTFDRLHTGHEALLLRAFEEGAHVTIGLTSDGYVRTYKHGAIVEENISGAACPCVSTRDIQDYETRKKNLEGWLRRKGVFVQTTIVPIEDLYGPTLGQARGREDFDAILVSEETQDNARRINAKRIASGLSELTVLTIPMVKAQDMLPLSSTRVRQGVIDQKGHLVMPVHLRKELTKPIGDIIREALARTIIRDDYKKIIVTVGDHTTKRLLQEGARPTFAIIDLQAERKPFVWEKDWWDKLPGKKVHVASGPGFISNEAIAYIDHWAEVKQPTTLVVDGEEDLLVLPVILHAPFGAVVYYGQPKKGLVRLVVTDEKKTEATSLLQQFC